VAEDLTTGELSRRIDELVRRMEQASKDADDRLTKLASDTVPTELWRAQHRSLEDDVKELREEVRVAVRDAASRIDRTSLERMGVLNGRIDAIDKRLRGHERSHAESGAWSRNKKLAVAIAFLGAAATIAGAWIAAALAAGGVH